MAAQREHWASRFGFVLAAAGSAIGLGNIWRFPYKCGEYGGGAFLAAYLGSVLVLGLPVMIAEIIIGRSSQKNPVGAFRELRSSRFWPLVGWMGILAGFIILSYYSVIGGWVLHYIAASVVSGFQTGMAAGQFQALMSSPVKQVVWHGLFMVLTVYIVRGGISSGIERWNKVLMPALFLILIGLMVRSLMSPGAGQALRFLLQPDFSKLTRTGILEALGSAFFSLSLGMGAMLTYGSYLDKTTNISSAALEISAAGHVLFRDGRADDFPDRVQLRP